MNGVFVSTGAFKSKSLHEILKTAELCSIYNIELSSGLNYDKDAPSLVKRYKERGFNFLVHNYFPAPERPFVLNLASTDDRIIERSVSLCEEAIKLARCLSAEFYSVHAGFAFDAAPENLGDKSQMNLRRTSIEKCSEIFIKTITRLNSCAKDNGVKLAIENNAYASFAKTAEKNELCLCVTSGEFEYVFDRIKDDNLYILLDLAHLKLMETNIRESSEDFINRWEEKIIAVHISDNNGREDTNDTIAKKTVIGNQVARLGKKYLILEAYSLTPEEIKSQTKLIQSLRMEYTR